MSDNYEPGSPREDPGGSYFCLKCWRRHIYGKSDGNWIWEEHREHAFTLPEEWIEPIGEACMSKQTTHDELLTEYLVRGLERDGIEVDDGRYTAKGEWHRAHDRGQLEFSEYDGNLVATFNEEMSFDVRSYSRSLPTRMRPEPSGREIEIKHVDNFIEWFGEDPAGIQPEEEDSTEGENASGTGVTSRIRRAIFE